MPLINILANRAFSKARRSLSSSITGSFGGVALHETVKEQDKAKEAERDIALTDSSKPCKPCPALSKVVPQEEKFNGGDVNLNYQLRICETAIVRREGGKYITEFSFRDWRLDNDKKEVKFDGWKPERCLFLEAKGRYDQFFDQKGVSAGWFTGEKEIIEQAIRQQNAVDLCDKIPKCYWHFMQPISYAYFKRMLNEFSGIAMFHTP